MVIGIEHIGIAAKDSTALKNWYMDLFGMKVVRDNGKGGYFIEDARGMQIEIYPAKTDAGCDFDNLTTGLRHIAFLIDNFDEMMAILKSKNVEFVGEPIIKETYSNMFFKDPEGNLLHVIERRE